MVAGGQCCCFHVLTAAKIVSIIGIFLGFLQVIAVFGSFIFVPGGVLYIVTYTCALHGASKKIPKFLIPAFAFMIIFIIISILFLIASIALGVINMDDGWNNDDVNHEWDHDEITTAFFLLAGIALFSTIFNILSVVIIWRSYKWIIQNQDCCYPPTMQDISAPGPQPPPPYYPQQDFPDLLQHNNNGGPKDPQIQQYSSSQQQYISSAPPPVQRHNSSPLPIPIESPTQQHYPPPQSSAQLPSIPQEDYFDEKL